MIFQNNSINCIIEVENLRKLSYHIISSTLLEIIIPVSLEKVFKSNKSTGYTLHNTL